MKASAYLILLCIVLSACTGGQTSKPLTSRKKQPSDTLYTKQKAMEVYGYQPLRALQIIDSAIIVGNVSPVWSDFLRARIYSQSVADGGQIDSLLGGPDKVRFDSARVIGERLLRHDSVKTSLGFQQDVLEILVYTARQQQDTARWLRWSQELVEVCHAQGAETEALRTEAEVGNILCYMGHREQGLARLDSVIALLDNAENRHFNELDATIIALKRKINVLSDEGHYVETLPLARRIIDRLDDYEQHPDDYHDSTYREPADSVARADYIQFYRTQAQSFITAAYALLSEHASMSEAYELIERSVREATAREHVARYHALEQQILRDQAESRSRMMTFVATASALGLLLILFLAALLFYQNRKIRKKNRVLVRMIEETLPLSLPVREGSNHHSECESSQKIKESTPLPRREGAGESLSLFNQIDTAIRTERLYANAEIQRKDICDRFGIRRDVLNLLLTDHAGGQSFPAYINNIRLSEACRLLSTEPEKTVNAIAEEVGLSPRNLRRLFVDQYGMTPTEYRQGLQTI